ncbi:GNAT family N-acetyltransferase [Gryllotalpicola reticulitermitis]|uniref:GNAT family N-acetyltransferase n=1 Tax=Gryllotalpicola reticulitermitis TaxID=1184153 RepID=A0ABV8Q168_9MICO
MLALRPFVASDDAELISWFPSDEALQLFAGVAGAWPLTPAQLERRRSEPGVHAYSAQLVGRDGDVADVLAGHVELVEAGAGSIRLARVAIAPALRGRGLAGQLVDRALDEARRIGATSAGLLVVPGNVPALRSYQRAGFVDAGVNHAFPQYVWMTRSL